jgi:hypothetical protein
VFSFDMKDGLYAVGMVPKQRSFLIANVRGQLYVLAGLPTGWSLSSDHLCAFTGTFMCHLPQSDLGGFTTKDGRPIHPDGSIPSKRYQRHTRWRGAKIQPFVDDCLLFIGPTRELALTFRQRIDHLLTCLGLFRHPARDNGNASKRDITWASTSKHHLLFSASTSKLL